MAKADKTKTPNPDLTPYYNPKHGFISEFKPSIADNLLGLLGDSPPANVLKGVYEALDYGLFGMLPNRNYLTPTAEENLGTHLGTLISPSAGFKSVKGLAKGLVSGVKIGNKSYPTPIGKLIANTIEPETYSSKFGDIKRALTNPKVLYDAVIKDMPQYVPRVGLEDRLWAHRKKFGIDYPPNKDYNRMLNLNSKKRIIGLNISDMPRSLKNIWNKFGKHTEDGTEYYHYKNSKDYFNQMQSDIAHQVAGGPWKHNVFGDHSRKVVNKRYLPNTSKEIRQKYKNLDDFYQAEAVHNAQKQIEKVHYYDDWDFGLNRSLKNTLFDVFTDRDKESTSGTLGLLSKIYKNPAYGKGLVKRLKKNIPIVLQRKLGNALTRDLKFKGTAKRIKQYGIQNAKLD